MILVFLLLSFIIILTLMIYILLLSNLKLKISKLHILKNSDEFKITLVSNVSIYLFNKIKLVEITIDDDKIKKFYRSGKINLRKIKENSKLNKEIIKLLRKISFKVESFSVEGYIGTENAAFTAYIIGITNAIIPLLLRKNLSNTCQYKNSINPIYVNENMMNIALKLSINIKIISIINVLIQNHKNRKQKLQEPKRKIYAYH